MIRPIRTRLLRGLAVLALCTGSAAAQETGGLALSAQGLALANSRLAAQALRPPLTGAPVQPPAGAGRQRAPAERQALHQQMVARVRGDAGLLAGFFHGQPVAPSRQPPPPPIEPVINFFEFIEAPFIVNAVNSNLGFDLGEGGAGAEAGAGGIDALSITNIDSTVNMAIGEGNVAQQQIVAEQP